MSAGSPPPVQTGSAPSGLFPAPPWDGVDESQVVTQLRPAPGRQASPDEAPGLIDVLAVPYAYAQIHELVARTKGVVMMRIVSLCITLLILIGLQLWRHFRDIGSAVFGWPYWVLLGVSLGVSLCLLAYAIVQWRRAARQAAMMGPGPALVIARPGVELAGSRVEWPEVKGLQARTPRFGGDQFLVNLADGTSMSIPFRLLDVAPSRLDSAARAFSAGHIGVDFSAMDN